MNGAEVTKIESDFLEIVKRTREAVGEDFIIVYRLSMLDLVEDGSTWEEVAARESH